MVWSPHSFVHGMWYQSLYQVDSFYHTEAMWNNTLATLASVPFVSGSGLLHFTSTIKVSSSPSTKSKWHFFPFCLPLSHLPYFLSSYFSLSMLSSSFSITCRKSPAFLYLLSTLISQKAVPFTYICIYRFM